MFLIPQEIADAGVNIASFYLITNCFKSLASKLVKSGKWAPKSVREFLNASPKNLRLKWAKVGFDILKDVKNVPDSIAKDYKSLKMELMLLQQLLVLYYPAIL